MINIIIVYMCNQSVRDVKTTHSSLAANARFAKKVYNKKNVTSRMCVCIQKNHNIQAVPL